MHKCIWSTSPEGFAWRLNTAIFEGFAWRLNTAIFEGFALKKRKFPA